jgi:lipopolysaccharide transport system ATP-binding protein
MTEAVVTVENLSKSYLVGHMSAARGRGNSATLRDAVLRGVRNVTRKTGDMLRGRQVVQGDEIEEFWALENVSFDVKRGDVLGVIGRNGAGKSTLLKILSRITEPTKGRILLRGRVSSLLEVGTGFHPELSGRENIFLNGAILGMSQREIRKKFDEIIDFAGVEKFLDTPVKRYSSGMYVRLAFAVAAHLEPEIMIVDEVLAVGDAQFQKKCLGKMSEVAGGGRTIVFVSHNMAMISSLCNKAIHLDNGKLRGLGATGNVILGYTSSEGNSPASVNYRSYSRVVGDQHAQLLSADIRDDQGTATSEVEIDKPCSVRMEYRIVSGSDRIFVPGFHFYRQDDTCAFVVNPGNVKKLPPGEYAAECHIPANFLNDGVYSVGFALASYESGISVHFFERGTIMFNVRDPIDGIVTRAEYSESVSGTRYSGPFPGAVRPLLPWTVDPI